MSLINRTILEKLAELARIELHENEKDKLVHDLGNILLHFEELKAVNTDGVLPLSGGTFEKNIFRDDVAGRPLGEDTQKLVEAFPEREGNYLKVPPVFE